MVAPLITAVGRTVAKKTTSDRVRDMAEKRAREKLGVNLRTTGEKPPWLLYMVLGMFALLKDMLDLVLGLIIGIGSVVSLATGMCFSLVAFLLLTIFDRSGSSDNLWVAKKMVHRAIIFVSATLVGTLPIIGSFVPETTLAIIVLYALARRAWKKGQKAQTATQGRARAPYEAYA